MGWRKGDHKREQDKNLKPAEVAALIRGAPTPETRLAIELAWYFGLRCGEVAVLRGQSFDLEDGVLWAPTLKRVRKVKRCRNCERAPGPTCYRKGHKVSSSGGPPKEPWRRTEKELPVFRVSIPENARAKAVSRQAARRGRDGWVFPDPADPARPRDTRWFRRQFARARRRAGIRPQVSFHALRHAHATAVAQATRDPVAVRDRLRHSSITTTNRYMHSIGDHRKELGAGLDLGPP